jgi:D-3-phosphoglycerate dehydrogenase / 2-oxoglutarate reductase
MKVIAVDHHTLQPVSIPLHIHGHGEINVQIQPTNNLAEALPQADFISIHVPKQLDGSAVFNHAEFDQMKKGVRIVNAARGGVINEQALINALDSGKVEFVALDVFENEPNPWTDLLKHERIACTPHIGAATVEAQDRIGEELAEQIVKAFGAF